MENQFNTPNPPRVIQPQDQLMLPHSIAILICGILGIQCSIIYGIPGLAFSITALVLGKRSSDYMFQNPGLYSEGSIKMYRAGRTCAIIGLILSILAMIGFAILFYYLFTNTGHHYQGPPPPPPPQRLY